MKRFKTTLVILISLGFFASASAQAKKRFKGKPIEAGITFGGSNYMGDLSRGVATNETHMMGGLICRFNYNDFVTLRGNAVFGQISGNDQNYKTDVAFQHLDQAGNPMDITRGQRNLNFKSNVVEF